MTSAPNNRPTLVNETQPDNTKLSPTPIIRSVSVNRHVVGPPANPSQSKFIEEWDASRRGSSIVDGPTMLRSDSVASQGDTLIPSRGGTLKKKSSMKRGSSLRRDGSRRSSRAGSVRSLALQQSEEEDEMRSAFYSPVPTSGNPTEILANRFTGQYIHR